LGHGGVEYEVLLQLKQQRLLVTKTKASHQNNIDAQVYEAKG
jgi:hypothetical protein